MIASLCTIGDSGQPQKKLLWQFMHVVIHASQVSRCFLEEMRSTMLVKSPICKDSITEAAQKQHSDIAGSCIPQQREFPMRPLLGFFELRCSPSGGSAFDAWPSVPVPTSATQLSAPASATPPSPASAALPSNPLDGSAGTGVPSATFAIFAADPGGGAPSAPASPDLRLDFPRGFPPVSFSSSLRSPPKAHIQAPRTEILILLAAPDLCKAPGTVSSISTQFVIWLAPSYFIMYARKGGNSM